MPRFSPAPTHPLDKAARSALRDLAACTPPLADALNVNPRTLQRIMAGQRYLPPALAADAAAHARALVMPATATRLQAWADHCQQESTRPQAAQR